jgi:ABC-2 type transport system ATP-binding protein
MTAEIAAVDAGRGRKVIEVRDVWKTFAMPTTRVDTLKERVLHPFQAAEVRELRALEAISFDVHEGEFIGLAGQNGSGKSTMLKILASVYRADRGTVRVAGRLAPFIELGVGFNPELTGRQNAILNGVMMGLSSREARARIPAIFAFAELEEFADLKLKNYSSGMMVRLAFAGMLQADADILIFDEVLAVGDAAFQQRCMDAFGEMRESGKTVVLVTHDMAAIEQHCHRALLFDHGKIVAAGSPAEIARAYLESNLRRHVHTLDQVDHFPPSMEQPVVTFSSVRLTDADGAPVEGLTGGEDVVVDAVVQAHETVERAYFSLEIRSGDGQAVLAIPYHELTADGPLAAGGESRVRTTVETPQGIGNYFVHCAVARDPVGLEQLVLRETAASFVVFAPKEDAPAIRYAVEVEQPDAAGRR